MRLLYCVHIGIVLRRTDIVLLHADSVPLHTDRVHADILGFRSAIPRYREIVVANCISWEC